MEGAGEDEHLQDSAGALALRDIYKPGQAVEVCEKQTLRLEAPMFKEPPVQVQPHPVPQDSAMSPAKSPSSFLVCMSDISQTERKNLGEEAAKLRNKAQGFRHLLLSLRLLCMEAH